MSFEADCLPLFVYGTLRPGQVQYQYLRGKTRAEYPACMEGVCLFSLTSFPMLVSLDRLPPHLNRDDILHTRVYGNLVVPHERHYERLLTQLDRYEDYNPCETQESMYWRELREVTVLFPEPQAVQAWVYMGNPQFLTPEHSVIQSGDWVQHCEHRLQRRRRFRLLNYCE